MPQMKPWEYSWAQNAPEEIEVWGDDLQSNQLRFNLRWVCAWRLIHDEDKICSGDAAWVFVKVKTGNSWQTAPLQTKARLHEAPEGCTIVPAEDGVGVFIHLGPDFSGLENNTVEGCVRLELAERLPAGAFCQVFALRMVYIPKIKYWLGSPKCSGAFHDARASHTGPYLVESEDTIEVTPEFKRAGKEKALHYASPTKDPGRYGDQKGPIPASFPKGYQAIYMMRSHVTQGQYADFINTLVGDERTLRFPYNAGAYRYTIRMDRNLFRVALRPRRPCNYLSWADATAYAAWAGLRPMTELEFEKACIHARDPVDQKYAWGDREIFPAQVIQSRGAMEVVVGNCNTGNRHSEFDGGDGGKGPVRDDLFALPGTLEEKFHGFGGLLYGKSFGSTYLGALGMSGNLWEMCVTVGNPQGRSFTGNQGDGRLVAGNAPAHQLGWPEMGGFGFRGGSWYTEASSCRVADRMHAIALGGNYVYRSHDVGFRGVRTAPSAEQHTVARLKDSSDLESSPHQSLMRSTGRFPIKGSY